MAHKENPYGDIPEYLIGAHIKVSLDAKAKVCYIAGSNPVTATLAVTLIKLKVGTVSNFTRRVTTTNC